MLIKDFLSRNSAGMIGAVLVVLACLVGISGPWIVPDPDAAFQTDIVNRLRPPSMEAWMGTDHLGRDVFSRIILGTRGALGVAFIVVAASMILGVTVGTIAGYEGGVLSAILMRITDVFLAVPQLILALALAQLLKPSYLTVVVALSLTYWPFFARTAYAETKRIASGLFVEALFSIGASRRRILCYHVLPNIAPAIIVRATIGIGFVILTAAVLSFLGMGAPPPTPDWGVAVAESRQFLPEAWWFALFPGIAIYLVVLGFNLLGDALRDFVDPRIRRSS
ncbi:MAG: ABC transporter permease [Hyphomicrobiaceae bacterium]|nr:ABC transporter permease [Hyphomicrobiaceae bacterium]